MEQAVQTNYIESHDTKVVLTIKYKIYIVILIVLIALTWGYMQGSVARHDATKESIVALENQKMATEAEYQQVIKDLIVVRDINAQKSAVLTCLSTRGCTTLPESVSSFIPQTRAFLQLQKNE